MPQADKPSSLVRSLLWIALPLLGIVLVYLFSQADPRGVLTEAWIRKIAAAAYVYLCFSLIYQLFCVLILDLLLGTFKHRPTPGIVKNIIWIAGVILSTVIVLDLLFPSAITYILTLSGVIGVVVGLALRPIILDIFSGVGTHLDAAFQIGDWVEVHESVDKPGYSGFIEEINWRTMLIRTKAGNYLICPNSRISTSLITNYSRPNRFSRFEISLKLPTEIDTKRALRLLQTAVDATRNHELGPCPEMEIQVYVQELKEAAVYYMVRYWIDRGQHSYRGSRHRIFQSIQHHLEMAGIPLAEDIFLNRTTSDIVHRGEKPALATIFAKLELFRGMTPEVIERIAEQSVEDRYSSGDTVITQGEEDDDMFVILEGGVDVVVDVEGSEVVVDEMRAGDYFGEMSLLTDSPRTATIRARSECRLRSVSRAAIKQLIDTDRSILPLLSENLAERNLNRSQKVETAKGALERDQKKSLTLRLLEKMKLVFG